MKTIKGIKQDGEGHVDMAKKTYLGSDLSEEWRNMSAFKEDVGKLEAVIRI